MQLCHIHPENGIKLSVHHRYTGEIPKPDLILYVAHIAVLRFSHNQNNCSVSYIYCGLSVKKKKTRKTLHGTQRSWAHLFCTCFCLKIPNLSPMADYAITQDRIRGLGSLVYNICGIIQIYSLGAKQYNIWIFKHTSTYQFFFV